MKAIIKPRWLVKPGLAIGKRVWIFGLYNPTFLWTRFEDYCYGDRSPSVSENVFVLMLNGTRKLSSLQNYYGRLIFFYQRPSPSADFYRETSHCRRLRSGGNFPPLSKSVLYECKSILLPWTSLVSREFWRVFFLR